MFRSTEQKTYSDILSKHISDGREPLLIEGGTGLGKTRAYLHSLALSGLRVAIILPSHQLIDQLLNSSDMNTIRCDIGVFRPARMLSSRAEYEANKQAAIAAKIMVCTSASVMIDQRLGGDYNGSTGRDYLLFDEADQLPEMAALQRDLSISAESLAEMKIKKGVVQDILLSIIGKKRGSIDAETRAAAKIMMEALNEPAWYQTVGFNDDGGIDLVHKMPGRLLKKISNQKNVAFVSATLSINGRFNNFRNAMGIGEISCLSTSVEPESHGSVSIHINPVDHYTDEWLAAVQSAIAGAEKPALIATASHADSILIGGLIPGAIVRSPDENTLSSSARVPVNGVLIAAGAWAGLDAPLRWKSIIVPRIPFGQSMVIDGERISSYVDSRNTAIRRMKQVLGRGLRTPDATCALYILDKRVKDIGDFVPVRFSTELSTAVNRTSDVNKVFFEGREIQFTETRYDRDPSLRRAALNHYGTACRAPGCGYVPTYLSEIDVHHKNPIANGPRPTSIKDVIVLCARCHRIAHAELGAQAKIAG